MAYTPKSTTYRDVVLCETCSQVNFLHLQQYLFGPLNPYHGWMISVCQCQGCGTTEFGDRYIHRTKTLFAKPTPKPTEQKPAPCVFNDYDRNIAMVARIKLD